MRDFNLRVRLLIDEHFDGNVSEASRFLGVSQRGLAKIYQSEVRTPRPVMMHALVAGFRNVEDPLWIMTGLPDITPQKLYQLMLDQPDVAKSPLTMALSANSAKGAKLIAHQIAARGD